MGGAASDMPADGWVDRLLPAPAQPWARLARLDRPIGVWLLLLPGWWSLTLAGASVPGVSSGTVLALMGLFAIGAVAMRGAGCVWNDIVDRRLDARVARTAARPIPAGQVGVFGAVAFMGLLLLAGGGVLLALNPVARLVCLGALVPVALYPMMKRVTHWPQAWLGLTFNWGALAGWAAATGRVEAPALLLYAAGFFWTLGYDTVYAHQDREDDALAGVKSLALRLGRRTRPWVAGFYAAALALLAMAGTAAGLPWRGGAAVAWLGPLALAGGHFAWQVARLDIDSPGRCLALFRANRDAGLLALAAFSLPWLWALSDAAGGWG